VALLVALSPTLARAQDEAPEIRESPCALPDGVERKLVTAVSTPTCGAHACAVEKSQAIVGPGDAREFGISEMLGDDEAGVELACGDRGLSLALEGSTLHLLVQGGRPRLDPADAAAIRDTWREHASGKPERIARLQNLRALVRTALGAEVEVAGVDHELVDVLSLAEVRERIVSGDFEAAQATLASLGHREKATAVKPALRFPVRPMTFPGHAPTEPALSPQSSRRRAELVRLLEAARAKSVTVKLGPRRRVGSAARWLRGPSEIGEAPTLFFDSGKLCVADVAPYRSGVARETLPPPPTGRMRCFAPNAAPPADDEAYRPPASSGNRLTYRDFTSPYNQCRGMVVAIHVGTPQGPHPCQGGPGVALEDVLAIVDRDAMLTLGAAGLELVRGPGKVEKVAPGAVAAIVARSAGTRLFVQGSSYFLERGRVARVGQSEDKTWLVLGPPPDGTYWLGTPVVSPDQRWVAAQSGRNERNIEVWVFPILSGGRAN
jgi:hypothetical protein